MSKLEDFLGLTDVSEIRETIDINVNGKKLSLVVRPITEEEHSTWQQRCVDVTKKKANFDLTKYAGLIIDNCIVEPDFKNAEFLEKAGCVSPKDFLNKKLPSGVISNISERIQKLSGFDTYDMEIENAKN